MVMMRREPLKNTIDGCNEMNIKVLGGRPFGVVVLFPLNKK